MKDKIIQIVYGKDEILPTLLTQSGKVYKWLPSDKYLGKRCIKINGNKDNVDIFEYKYIEIKTL